VVLLSVFVRTAPAAQDKYTMRALNGVALSGSMDTKHGRMWR
jgi:hypothetical protein